MRSSVNEIRMGMKTTTCLILAAKIRVLSATLIPMKHRLLDLQLSIGALVSI